MARRSKNPSQNTNREPQVIPKQQPISNKSTVPWSFGYPQCVNKKQSRLVCLHSQCEKYPFFCSACQDQSCQNEHQHKDKITSIGFKQLIKRLINQRKPPEQLQKCVNAYKKQLQQLLKNVTQFVNTQSLSMDEILKKSIEVEQSDEKIIQKLKDKKYQQIKGKQLDTVWNKVAPTEHKKKMQKQIIQFVDSKRVQVEEMTNNFRDGLKGQSNRPQSKLQNESNKVKPVNK